MLLPVGDNVDRRSLPVVPAVLVFANLLVFVIQVRIFLDNPMTIQPTMDFIEKWGLVPADLQQGRYVGLFTHMFLHAGFFHVAGNMLFLWVFGDNVEDRLGRVRYIALYFGSGLVALTAQVVSDPSFGGPMVGASGAVAGVLGAYLRLFPHARVLGLVPLGFLFFTVAWPAGVFLGIWIAMQVLSALMSGGIEGGVAWWAHIGGFALGFLVASPKRARKVERSHRAYPGLVRR